jgi:hypothetical protein
VILYVFTIIVINILKKFKFLAGKLKKLFVLVNDGLVRISQLESRAAVV